MSGEVTIKLDATVVKNAVSAKIGPAVEKILSTVDIPSRIMKALMTEPPKPSKDDSYRTDMMMRYALFNGYGGTICGANDTRAAIETLIDEEIGEAAKTFIAKEIKANSKKIEAAFKSMMANSANSLAKTLVHSLEHSLENEWSFTLDTKVSAKEPSRDSWYDD